MSQKRELVHHFAVVGDGGWRKCCGAVRIVTIIFHCVYRFRENGMRDGVLSINGGGLKL